VRATGVSRVGVMPQQQSPRAGHRGEPGGRDAAAAEPPCGPRAPLTHTSLRMTPKLPSNNPMSPLKQPFSRVAGHAQRLLAATCVRLLAAEAQLAQVHSSGSRLASTLADTAVRGMGGSGGGREPQGGDDVARAEQLEEKLTENASLQGRLVSAEDAKARHEAAAEAARLERVQVRFCRYRVSPSAT
jgi:hypothetical protein